MSKPRVPAIVLAVLLAAAAPVVVAAGRDPLHELVRAGEIMPFEAIRAQVMRQVPGEYMGAEIDATNRIYRFRFLVQGTLMNVDVDARTGQRLNRRQRF